MNTLNESCVADLLTQLHQDAEVADRVHSEAAIVLGENAFEPGYLDYIRDPANGDVSLALPDAERGNEFSVRVS